MLDPVQAGAADAEGAFRMFSREEKARKEASNHALPGLAPDRVHETRSQITSARNPVVETEARHAPNLHLARQLQVQASSFHNLNMFKRLGLVL